MNVLWIGEPGIARQELARRAPQVRVSECAVASAWDLLGSGGVRADLLVVDTTLAGLDVQEFLTRRERYRIELPTILLTPQDHDLPDPAGDMAGLDRVVKTDNFVLQLLTSFNLALGRHELHVQLRASRQGHDRLRGILDSQPAATCAFGPDGVLTAMNQAGFTMLGATREQVVGQPVSSFVAVADRPAAAALIRRVYEGQPSEIAVALLRPDGRRLQAHLRAVPYLHGDRLVALASLEERKILEESATLRHSLAADHEAVLELREALVRALGDAERHCRLLLERQEAALKWCAELNARQRS